MLQVSSLRDSERFLRACSLRTAQLLNRAELSRDIGVAGSSVAAWLSVLEASGQVALSEPSFSNRTKSLVKRPKLYMGDTGLCSFLNGIREASDLNVSPLVGPLWETLVFGQIRRGQSNRRGGWDLHFWRDRAKEADFLLHRGGRFELADAKWTEHPTHRDALSLSRIADEFPAVCMAGTFIVSRCLHPYPVSEFVQAIPLESLPDRWR